MKRIVLIATLAAATGSLVAAQLYRWVDDKGNVEYRDTPPPKHAKKVEERRLTGNTIETSTASFDLQQATKNYPVTLWAYDCGEPCSNARALLAKRGVPYTEKDPKADLKAFEKLTGSVGVPVLYVGKSRLIGYLETDWDKALDAAGYPKTAPPGVAAKAAAKPAAKPAPEAKPPAEKAADATPQGTVEPSPPIGAEAPRRAGK